MLRIFIFILFLMNVCSIVSAAPGEGTPEFVGAGAVVSTSPYDGVDTKAMAVPFLSGEYKDFYVQGVEAGYRFLKNENLTVSAIVSPRFMGYDSDDSDALNGMRDRRMSMDAGLKADYALADQLTLSGKVVADALGRSDGMEYELSLRRPVKGNSFRLVPSVGVRYQSGSMVDYYYGVRDNEVRSARAAYEPRGSLNPFANMIFSSGISKRWVMMAMLGVESLGSEIRKSPIVDESYVVSAAAGLTYRF